MILDTDGRKICFNYKHHRTENILYMIAVINSMIGIVNKPKQYVQHIVKAFKV